MFAVQFPEMLNSNPDTDFNGNRAAFIKAQKPVIFWPNFKYRFTKGIGFSKQLKRSPFFNPDEYEFAFSVRELNRKADVLVHFNQYPLDLERLLPPKGFNGLKVWHIYEFVFQPSVVNKMLVENGVDYLLGYADHGKYSPFFQSAYPAYTQKVIPFPFGTSNRFLVDSKWEGRENKVIALGAVNLVNEEGGTIDDSLKSYSDFYKDRKFTHEWRRMLVENESQLSDIMDSQLPHFPETKNSKYDALQMMLGYTMFANDEGLLAFPPARTFEGASAGAVMVSSNHPCYTDLGFKHGVNCIMHCKHDIGDFREKVIYFQQQPQLLKKIAEEGQKLIRTHYTQEIVAKKLAEQLKSLYSTGKKPETKFEIS
ncbi:glycosyltransferase [Parasediminibacterium sp. JCM 36343]|uniref:glycosyltransferase n=1 Tax=Parasediminibacterium sp. JCM 36343 TaxID=3374279 RepID=UPI00397B9998